MKKLFTLFLYPLCLMSILALTLLGSSSFAASLMEAYESAMGSDPIYHGAIAAFKANREALPQSIAQMLFNVSYNANAAHNWQYDTSVQPTMNFYSRQAGITLSQPLFNFANWEAFKAASASVKGAYASLLSAKQNLILRLATAYLGVLQAEDNLRFTLADKRFAAQQLEQSQQQFKVGLQAITNVYEAQAAYDQKAAAEINARNNVKNALEKLREITGVLYVTLAPLKGQVPLLRPVPSSAAFWETAAAKSNLDLIAARYNALAKRENIKIQFAGHFPVVTAQGSWGYLNNERQFFSGHLASVGVNLQFPVYTSGLVTSQTKQARYQYLQANTQMESAYRTAISSTRQSFNNIVSGLSQVRADHQSIISNVASLNGTIAAYRVGTRTIVDVLNIQQALSNAQRLYMQDQYAYILSILNLKAATGRLNEDELLTINNWLAKQEIEIGTDITYVYPHTMDTGIVAEEKMVSTTPAKSTLPANLKKLNPSILPSNPIPRLPEHNNNKLPEVKHKATSKLPST